MKEGFLCNADVGLLFFRICSLYKIKDEKDRVSLLRKIVSRNKAKYIRDVDKFVEGKNVIVIRKKR